MPVIVTAHYCGLSVERLSIEAILGDAWRRNFISFDQAKINTFSGALQASVHASSKGLNALAIAIET